MEFREEALIRRVREQLAWDASVDSGKISVEARDGKVTLNGTVPNYGARIAAERDTYSVEGVREVENLLQIEFPPSEPVPSDGVIEDHVRQMLMLNARIKSSDISVTAEKGIVVLTGSVDSMREKAEAGDVTNSVSGVTDVINNLKVGLSGNVNDEIVENDIRDAFRRNAMIDDKKIDVKVNKGVARLSGEVPSYLSKREVYQTALFTTNVADVIDNIIIR